MHKSPDPFAGCVVYPDGMVKNPLNLMIIMVFVVYSRVLAATLASALLTFPAALNQQIYPQASGPANSFHQQGLRLFS